MTSKTISVTEEVFRLLSRMKLPGESFSQTIRRLIRRSRISECAGLWSGLREEELEDIRRQIRLLRQRANKEFVEGGKGESG